MKGIIAQEIDKPYTKDEHTQSGHFKNIDWFSSVLPGEMKKSWNR